jgi:hypothetical protein
MCERVQLLEKASRQFELDNERLAFKVTFLNCTTIFPSYDSD